MPAYCRPGGERILRGDPAKWAVLIWRKLIEIRGKIERHEIQTSSRNTSQPRCNTDVLMAYRRHCLRRWCVIEITLIQRQLTTVEPIGLPHPNSDRDCKDIV